MTSPSHTFIGTLSTVRIVLEVVLHAGVFKATIQALITAIWAKCQQVEVKERELK